MDFKVDQIMTEASIRLATQTNCLCYDCHADMLCVRNVAIPRCPFPRYSGKTLPIQHAPYCVVCLPLPYQHGVVCHAYMLIDVLCMGKTVYGQGSALHEPFASTMFCSGNK